MLNPIKEALYQSIKNSNFMNKVLTLILTLLFASPAIFAGSAPSTQSVQNFQLEVLGMHHTSFSTTTIGEKPKSKKLTRKERKQVRKQIRKELRETGGKSWIVALLLSFSLEFWVLIGFIWVIQVLEY